MQDTSSEYINNALQQQDMLTVAEFIKVTNYPIDTFMIDKFWNTIEDNKLIYVDEQLIRWMGYEGTPYSIKTSFKKLLTSCGEYYEYNNDEYEKYIVPINTMNIYPTLEKTRGKNRTLHLLLTPKCLKIMMMKLSTPKSDSIREYYFNLECLFKEYVKYQNLYKGRQQQIELDKHKLALTIKEQEIIDKNKIITGKDEIINNKDEIINNKDKIIAKKDTYINNVKSYIENVKPLQFDEYVYIATTDFYASRNQFKIGKANKTKPRLTSYNTGRPEGDRYYYVYIWPTADSSLLEKKITTHLRQWQDSKDREMYVISYNWLCPFVRQVCEHDRVEIQMINDLTANYAEIIGQEPPKMTPLVDNSDPNIKAIEPPSAGSTDTIQFTFTIKNWTPEQTKSFIINVLEEYKRAGNTRTSWTALSRMLTDRFKPHSAKPNIKNAKLDIESLCRSHGIILYQKK